MCSTEVGETKNDVYTDSYECAENGFFISGQCGAGIFICKSISARINIHNPGSGSRREALLRALPFRPHALYRYSYDSRVHMFITH